MQPQTGFIPPMTQPGMPPGSFTGGWNHRAGVQNTERSVDKNATNDARCPTDDARDAPCDARHASWHDANGWDDATWTWNAPYDARDATCHRPGMSPLTQAPPVTAPGMLNRPAVPAATAPAPQPTVTKPLFPSAGQVGALQQHHLHHPPCATLLPLECERTFLHSTLCPSPENGNSCSKYKYIFTKCRHSAQQAVSGPVGTDFKPLSTPATSSDPPKVTFPAYTQATASTANPSSSTVSKPPATVTSKPPTLTTTSATSKLIHPDEDISLEERRAQLPRYQRNIPRPGQAHMAVPPVGPMGAMMPPQQGMPPQQSGQYGAPPQGMPGYMPGGMPPYGQGPPMVPPFQGGPPRPPMGMRPPVMSQGGRY
ncbi:hypothetical protein JZ751_026815 [Albula glossodonta]|uniref:Uncharacterized protein n=1 Tax=Albula glossodonta TaxID=121402 RepID=A0A8T2PL22_9TELE|nr:hypothetical protein JZ751_026815 [Albula glossodonta]